MVHNPFHEIVDSIVVECAYGNRVPHRQLVELGRVEFAVVVVNLVHRQHHRFLRGAKATGRDHVGRSYAIGHVRHENDDVGVIHRHLGLFLYPGADLPFRGRLQSSGIQQYETVAFPLCVSHQPVPGGARHVRHDGMPPSDDPVEERRFAHIGASNNGDYGKGHPAVVSSIQG